MKYEVAEMAGSVIPYSSNHHSMTRETKEISSNEDDHKNSAKQVEQLLEISGNLKQGTTYGDNYNNAD